MRTPEMEALEATIKSSGSGLIGPRAPFSSQRWLGLQVDHFRVERTLGRGGMGIVYGARDMSLDRPVALKVLPEELTFASPSARQILEERFIREARAQAKLNSPHVVHIYYIGHLPAPEGGAGSLYFAMELVDGAPLEATLDRRALLDPEEARQLMLQVAHGLRDAYRAGIIHRDIKPSNILRDKNGYVKIADFGIAKPLDQEGDKSITQDGILLGTPLYMAPEQARGEAVDHRADMYAFGATFHHLIAGEPPYDAPTPIAVLAKHFSEPVPKLAALVKDVPPALAAIIEKMLGKTREERFDSYDDLIAALEAAAPESKSYVGFWARGAAATMDMVVTGGLIALLGWVGLVVHFFYVILATGLRGQTIAKYLMRFQVQRPDGRRLGLLRSSVRTVSSLWFPFLIGALTLVTRGKEDLRIGVERMGPTALSELKSVMFAVYVSHALLTLLYLAGLAVAAFHPKKRALHDMLADSEVVYRLTPRKPSDGPGDRRELKDRRPGATPTPAPVAATMPAKPTPT